MIQALDALRKAIKLLEDLQKSQPQAQLKEGIRLLMTVAEEMDRIARPVERRRGGGVDYTIEVIGGRPLLTEHRQTGSKPFRAGYEIFSAVVAVLAQGTEPHSYELIAQKVAGVIQPEPGSHQVRMVLRFMLRKGLIGRSKNRYGRSKAVTTSRQFTKAAEQVWKTISS